MEAGALRPLDLGASLDAAIKIFRARFRPLVTVVFVTTVPVLVLSTLVQLSSGSATSITKTDPGTNLPAFDGKGLALFLAGTGVVLVLAVVSGALATAGAFRIISGVYLGDEPTWQESLSFAWHRLGSVLWVTVLTLLATLLGVLALLVGYVWARTVFAFAVPVLLVEGVRGRQALGRSRQLVKGRFWPVFATLLVATLLAGAVQGAISAPAIILTFTRPGSVAGSIVQFITGMIATTLVTPFSAAIAVVVYFDLRVRKEGFDLVLLAQRVGLEPAPHGFPHQPGAPRFPAYPPQGPPPGWGQAPPGWSSPPGWSAPPPSSQGSSTPPVRPGWSPPAPPIPPPPAAPDSATPDADVPRQHPG